MARKIIRRYLPDAQRLRAHRGLRLFGRWLQHPGLWQLNRRSVSGACAVGLFWAFIPSPTQMLPAALTAMLARVNLPLSVALVWVANPLAMPPMFYFNYRVGVWLLDLPERPFRMELSWAWLGRELGAVWEPLAIGSLAVASGAALLGYFGMRVFWQVQVTRAWTRRRLRRP
jgi:uncharacterized protein (DUF2062 family)